MLRLSPAPWAFSLILQPARRSLSPSGVIRTEPQDSIRRAFGDEGVSPSGMPPSGSVIDVEGGTHLPPGPREQPFRQRRNRLADVDSQIAQRCERSKQ